MAKKNGFIEEFKTFISQGSVMDLAIGMVIGAAFTAIVTSLVNDIIMPIVGLLIGGIDFSNLSIRINNFFGGNDQVVIRYGAFLQSVVNFVVVAFALFLVVRILNRMKARAKALADKKAKKEADEDAEEEKKDDDVQAEQVKLLREIRDNLKKSK
ncbi:large conductance mechanosensitive channel protein MscL [Candidatus Saccharibacteria bacterium]|nr:large conductance mechanosensitive channel protein MscL [Candidatus Saccharibacteria bacterium]